MGVLSGNPQDEPLHYGEVFASWTHLSTCNVLIAGYKNFLQHTGDKDLRKLIEEFIKKTTEEKIQLKELLKSNGIALPPDLPDIPNACLEDIPIGARFTDPQITAALTMDVGKVIIACSQVIIQSIREDIALMYGQFHNNNVNFAAKLLRLNKDKGWLIPPPLHLKKC